YKLLTATPDNITLETAKLVVKVDMEDGAVRFYDSKGKLLLKEADGGKSFTPITVEGTDAYTVSQTFDSPDDDEGIYGLGQHQANEFNYKGKNEALFQYNTKVSVPFVVSTGNYGLLWDSYSLCRWGNSGDYLKLGEVFKLYDTNGEEGALTGRYVAADSTVIERREPEMTFEYLERPELKYVNGLPKEFKFRRSSVTYSGEIEPAESGRYDFQLYYSGYVTVFVDSAKVVDTRWRTSWNPNAYKFSLTLEKGKRVPVRIEWQPDGDVAYCGLRVYPAADTAASKRMRWWGEMQDMIDYYFIYGEDMDEIISGNRELTGRAPIMPKWAMGYWQSREKYNTADEVLSTVDEFRRRNIPLDNIVIDWLHWPQDAWGS
ncbi:MAG: alpha-xylosidase, partial [Duncaniella sp.]|nr:alpha-xylosidase [Duncaniella sp.]